MSDDNEDDEEKGGAKRWLHDNIRPLLIDMPARGNVEGDQPEDPNPGDVDEVCPVCHHALSRHTEEREEGTNRVFRRCPDGTVIETEADAETGLEGNGTQDGPILS